MNASRFFVLPDWAPYATATCKCPRAWQAAMAASSRDKQQSGTVGCREYSSIFVSSETAPCSRASARVLVRVAARMRHFLAPRKVWETPAQSVFQLKTPTPVWSFYQLQALRSGTWPISDIFSKRGRKRRFARNRFARDARRRRDAVARRRRGWRSIAHTASVSDSANRRRVWSPDAARLA